MKHEFKIGRDSSNHIIIDDASISRNHALLTVIDENFKIRDLDSLNGTFINGVRIKGEAKLETEDILKLGSQLIPWMSYVESADSLVEIAGASDGKPEGAEIEETVSSEEYEIEEVVVNGNLKDNAERSKWATNLIYVVLIFDVITLVSDFIQHQLLQKIEGGDFISNSTVNANDDRVMGIALIALCIMIVSIVTFIRWFRRAYFNLHQLSPNMKYSEGMAAGCWFIPFINFYRPYEIMKEMFEKSNYILNKSGSDLNEESPSNIAGLWWTLWIISTVINQVIFRTDQTEIGDFLFVSNISLLSDLVSIILALVTISMIKKYSNLEKSLATLE